MSTPNCVVPPPRRHSLLLGEGTMELDIHANLKRTTPIQPTRRTSIVGTSNIHHNKPSDIHNESAHSHSHHHLPSSAESPTTQKYHLHHPYSIQTHSPPSQPQTFEGAMDLSDSTSPPTSAHFIPAGALARRGRRPSVSAHTSPQRRGVGGVGVGVVGLMGECSSPPLSRLRSGSGGHHGFHRASTNVSSFASTGASSVAYGSDHTTGFGGSLEGTHVSVSPALGPESDEESLPEHNNPRTHAAASSSSSSSSHYPLTTTTISSQHNIIVDVHSLTPGTTLEETSQQNDLINGLRASRIHSNDSTASRSTSTSLPSSPPQMLSVAGHTTSGTPALPASTSFASTSSASSTVSANVSHTNTTANSRTATPTRLNRKRRSSRFHANVGATTTVGQAEQQQVMMMTDANTEIGKDALMEDDDEITATTTTATTTAAQQYNIGTNKRQHSLDETSMQRIVNVSCILVEGGDENKRQDEIIEDESMIVQQASINSSSSTSSSSSSVTVSASATPHPILVPTQPTVMKSYTTRPSKRQTSVDLVLQQQLMTQQQQVQQMQQQQQQQQVLQQQNEQYTIQEITPSSSASAVSAPVMFQPQPPAMARSSQQPPLHPTSQQYQQHPQQQHQHIHAPKPQHAQHAVAMSSQQMASSSSSASASSSSAQQASQQQQQQQQQIQPQQRIPQQMTAPHAPFHTSNTGRGSTSSAAGGYQSGSTRTRMPISPTRAPLISVLSCVLEQLFSNPNDTLPTDPAHISMFHTSTIPSITIGQYLDRIAYYSECSEESLVMAFIHISRIYHANSSGGTMTNTGKSFQLNTLSIHRLLLVAIMSSSKFYDDQYFNNAFFGRIGGVTTKELNTLEVEFLAICAFELYIPSKIYRRFFKELTNPALHPKCKCMYKSLPIVEFDDSLPISPAHDCPLEELMYGPGGAPQMMMQQQQPTSSAAAAGIMMHPQQQQQASSSSSMMMNTHPYVSSSSMSQQHVSMQHYTSSSTGNMSMHSQNHTPSAHYPAHPHAHAHQVHPHQQQQQQQAHHHAVASQPPPPIPAPITGGISMSSMIHHTSLRSSPQPLTQQQVQQQAQALAAVDHLNTTEMKQG